MARADSMKRDSKAPKTLVRPGYGENSKQQDTLADQKPSIRKQDSGLQAPAAQSMSRPEAVGRMGVMQAPSMQEMSRPPTVGNPEDDMSRPDWKHPRDSGSIFQGLFN